MKQNKQQEESSKAKSNYTPLFIIGGIVLIIFVFVLIAKLDTSSSDSNRNYMTTGNAPAKETVSEQGISSSYSPAVETMEATYGSAFSFMFKTMPIIIGMLIVFQVFGARWFRRAL